jgi:hypothetical protein
MSFNRENVASLLAECQRRCCICHRFCGVKIETDHITPKDEGGNDDIDNAIPVCFDCHAEIHSYNPKHPRGRKFTPAELKQHKDSWLQICKERPDVLLSTNQFQNRDVGPLQGLVDELEFNLIVASKDSNQEIGCLFREFQFSRALDEGAISILHTELKKCLINAYIAMGAANQVISNKISASDGRKSVCTSASNDLTSRLSQCKNMIQDAHEKLLTFLGHEQDNG